MFIIVKFVLFILLQHFSCINNLFIKAFNMGMVMFGEFAGAGKAEGNLQEAETHQG